MMKWREEMGKVQQCPQRQDSALNQITDLYSVANKLGFYDAADLIKYLFIDKKSPSVNNIFK